MSQLIIEKGTRLGKAQLEAIQWTIEQANVTLDNFFKKSADPVSKLNFSLKMPTGDGELQIHVTPTYADLSEIVATEVQVLKGVKKK